MNYKHIRIHGDNIVECERTLNLIHESIGGELKLQDCPIYLPTYELKGDKTVFRIELLSGHGRWGVNIGNYLIEKGGILREGADSYICEIKNNNETFLLAIEYCSALPAGNNAWQRNGRALSSVLAGVPYLYITEFGGVELNENRDVKAPRYPNPLVPFSYLCASKDYGHPCVPVYRPHPSISEHIYSKFSEVFGYNNALAVLKGILTGKDEKAKIKELENKALRLIEILSNEKRGNSTLRGSDWRNYLNSNKRASWIIEHSDLIWKKKLLSKVNTTDRIKRLIPKAVGLSLGTIGASDIPICLIERHKINELENVLHELYPDIAIRLPKDKPLCVVWITGYKPQGDDSRPDRGLCPLAKMVLGKSCRVISIVYGPARPQTWSILENGIKTLADRNGLWQSIYKICDGVLIDSVTKGHPEYISIRQKTFISTEELTIPYHSEFNLEFSEHDTDTAIHQILSKSGLIECLCNPPGGDWSGINYYTTSAIYRWTSLPRVSIIGGKRPDHVFQQKSYDKNLFILIESKENGNDLEGDIGIKLALYIQNIFTTIPTSIKRINADWRLNYDIADIGRYNTISVGAFIYKNDVELQIHLDRGKLDCIMAFEFKKPTVLHILYNRRGRIIEDFIKKASERINGLEVKIH